MSASNIETALAQNAKIDRMLDLLARWKDANRKAVIRPCSDASELKYDFEYALAKLAGDVFGWEVCDILEGIDEASIDWSGYSPAAKGYYDDNGEIRPEPDHMSGYADYIHDVRREEALFGGAA